MGLLFGGSISNRKLKKLFNAQKNILRVLFGDREKFLDKFRTCIRARPYPEQNLPTEFLAKNIVNHFLLKNKILNLKNLYLYHCANETFIQVQCYMEQCKKYIKIDDHAASVSILKLKLKTYLLNKQLLGDAEN